MALALPLPGMLPIEHSAIGCLGLSFVRFPRDSAMLGYAW